MTYEDVYNEIDNGTLAIVFPDWKNYKKNIDIADKKYPRLSFTFETQEIENLSNLINCDGLVDYSKMESTTEKLLYSILWKQGDLQKIKHVIDGIHRSSSLESKKEQRVFYQFGHHLSDRNEPIIDVNVFKAYATYTNDRKALIKSGISKGPNGLNLTNDYIKWFKRITKGKNFHFELDRIMFAIGQQIKLPK